MDKNANTYRDLATASAIVNGKTELGEFDVFMCHNNQNKAEVIRIATKLKEKGIRPWLDEWELRPGLSWQRLLEQQIENIKSVAIFVGKNGIGPWQDLELGAFIREFIKRSMPVIPVILPDCQQPPALPIFLTSMTWVDFRKESPDPFEHLTWGITGKRE
ncbi:MAG: toll/interleukin-1 receptor domain-containing protein, partial [Anaerolineae bacterium]